MLEKIIVALLVAGAAVYVWRAMRRSVKGEGCPGCSDGNCRSVDSCKTEEKQDQ